jgi:hypothetical protein
MFGDAPFGIAGSDIGMTTDSGASATTVGFAAHPTNRPNAATDNEATRRLIATISFTLLVARTLVNNQELGRVTIGLMMLT